MSEVNSIIFSVDGNTKLRDEVVDYVRGRLKDIEKGSMTNRTFKDGEVNVDFNNTIRGKRVYLLTSPNSSDELFKLLFAIDAAKRASAKEIVPIIPYFPYARQDKKDQHRGAIGAKVLASFIENRGATKVFAIELHSDQIVGFFDIATTNIQGRYILSDYIANKAREHNNDIVLASADAGGGKRLEKMAARLLKKYDIDVPLVFAHKTRVKDNEVAEMRIIGDVEGKHVIFLDDMLDTGGTLCAAANAVMEHGAKSTEGVVVHVVASGNAVDNIENSALESLTGTNTLPIPDHSKFNTISVAPEIGKAIIADDYSISFNRLQES